MRKDNFFFKKSLLVYNYLNVDVDNWHNIIIILEGKKRNLYELK